RKSIYPVYGEEYVKRLAGARIGLCVLSKWSENTTHSASRTFEIPAIGSLFLAERTPDHLRYYQDGDEAVFFDSLDELVSKTRELVASEPKRAEIAQRGHARCWTSGYTHKDRVEATLRLLQ